MQEGIKLPQEKQYPFLSSFWSFFYQEKGSDFEYFLYFPTVNGMLSFWSRAFTSS